MDELASLVMEHLPDSIEGRRKMIHTLLKVVPKSSELHPQLVDVAAHLNQHVIAQREFVFARKGRQ